METSESELERLRRRAEKRRAGKRQQRRNKRAKEAAAKAAGAAAASAVAASASATQPPAACGAPPPGLDPAARAFVPTTARSSTTATSVDVAAVVGASPPAAGVRRVRSSALQAGPGDLPVALARSLLLEKISSAMAAQGSQDRPVVPRACVFPGESQVRFLNVLVGTRAALCSEAALGVVLDAQLDEDLTDQRLRQLVARFSKVGDGPLFSSALERPLV